ncbi:hypothetical protein DSO57_1018439 [Entomophthora muscae]|uniref:Uncharacterized protein n=1 Tax=Entomophthora muscae TaxID=34485 RepID=A0ACC2UE61_9FUNG|nr:hypothetical protein DSO57_1018439 [Entomophthora muscae]
MKLHFKNANIGSFFRQLNLYGFKRSSDGRKFRGRGRDNWCHFQHPYLLLSDPTALAKIQRYGPKISPTINPPHIQNHLLDSYTIESFVYSEEKKLMLLDYSPPAYIFAAHCLEFTQLPPSNYTIPWPTSSLPPETLEKPHPKFLPN